MITNLKISLSLIINNKKMADCKSAIFIVKIKGTGFIIAIEGKMSIAIIEPRFWYHK